MLSIRLGYPEPEYERRAILAPSGFGLLDRMDPVLTKQDVLDMQGEAENVLVEESILDYILAIVGETRRHEKIRLGVSTRGAQFFVRAVRALAYCEDRDYAVPDDVRDLAPLVLGHRIILTTRRYLADAEDVISGILDKVPVPV
jgi:MoxR-like ATPase